jgi:hypothetical protein
LLYFISRDEEGDSSFPSLALSGMASAAAAAVEEGAVVVEAAGAD